MNRAKNLSIPLISALLATGATQLSAQNFRLDIKADKTYRQSKSGLKFQEGEFSVAVQDGSLAIQPGCNRPAFWFPNIAGDPCRRGSTGQIIGGGILDKESVQGSLLGRQISSITTPYITVDNIRPATVMGSSEPQSVSIIATPKSTLQLPLGSFVDKSYSIFFNLQSETAGQFTVSRYRKTLSYSSKELDKYDKEIVDGAYFLRVPRLGLPGETLGVNATILPMIDGVAKLNNQTSGFEFTSIGANRWTKDGFAEMSLQNPNKITWRGVRFGSNVFAADKLFLSIRVLKREVGKKSAGKFEVDEFNTETGFKHSIFPAFNAATGADSRVLLTNSTVSTYTLPPVIPSGTKGVLEIAIDRSLQQGTSVDSSNRKFQVPVIFVDRFSEYAQKSFNKSNNSKILDDFDGDGFNNLTEWALDSSATVRGSQPPPLVPQIHITQTRSFQEDGGFFIFISNIITELPYFGFTVDRKIGTVPSLDYLLQRSRDGGKTWLPFATDENWLVTYENIKAGELPYRQNESAKSRIVVTAIIRTTDIITGITTIERIFTQPPGTENDIYRVKVGRK
jgi:hypothetical protein